MGSRWTAVGAAVALSLFCAGDAFAQSLSSARGLGYPFIPVDARAEILGGLGIGLEGFAATMINPAAAAGAARKGGVMALTVNSRQVGLQGPTEKLGTTRFPLVQLIYPTRWLVLTGGYGGYLDQNWGVLSQGTATLGTQTVGYNDRLESVGGVSTFQLGAAVPLGPRFAVGASLGAHTGSQHVTYQRLFDTTSIANLQPYNEASARRYFGPTAQFGVRWDPLNVLRIGASVTWSGDLSVDSTAGPAGSFDVQLPLQVAMGASGYLAPGLLAAVSGRWSGWSGTQTAALVPFGDVTDDITARNTWEVGGGLEWARPNPRATRTFPVRVGFQYRQLPFTFVSNAPTEWYVGAGLGMRVGADPSNPIASVDLSVERGSRSAAGSATIGALSEQEWRVGLSFALFGT